jgi:hypothetical protein
MLQKYSPAIKPLRSVVGSLVERKGVRDICSLHLRAESSTPGCLAESGISKSIFIRLIA